MILACSMVPRKPRAASSKSAVLEIELHRGACALDRGQGIQHDDTGIAFNQRHVGGVEAAHGAIGARPFRPPAIQESKPVV